ncbi:MAG: hypothetical protein JW844_03865 [Candidatus Omnitrophica bacterium]|nr:hypothetical protein [Candidatus Omnitrophota bacterium]
MIKFNNTYPPAKRGKIIVWGMISSFPFGGMIWQVLHHLVGFRRLGFDVWYVEDSDRYLKDPKTWWETNEYAASVEFLSQQMRAIGFEDRWVFRPPERQDICFGAVDRAGLDQLYKDADCVINLCGAQEALPYHEIIQNRVYLETDPTIPQIEIALGYKKTIDNYSRYQHIFTYGENIGNDDCLLPVEKFQWLPTRPPVITDWWNPINAAPRYSKLTTISNWDTKHQGIKWKGEIYYWQKDFIRFIDLPRHSAIPLELTLGGISEKDENLIVKKGWLFKPAQEVVDIFRYNDYVCDTLGEFTVAKQLNVKAKSGWFSDRSVCYLAAGRPVITEDTGFCKFVPTGKGLFAFRNTNDIITAIDAIHSDYERHSKAAREIAEEYFKAEKVLGKIIDAIGL